MNNKNQLIPHRIIYSIWDFQQAISALTFILDECDFDKPYSKEQLRKFRCFETTAIVSFSRPFKVGRGRKPLDLSIIDFKYSEDEYRLKDKILQLRDKIISHSDEAGMEYITHSFKISDDSEIRMPITTFRESLYLNKNEYHIFESFLRRLLQAVVKHTFQFVQSNPVLFEQLKHSTVFDDDA